MAAGWGFARGKLLAAHGDNTTARRPIWLAAAAWGVLIVIWTCGRACLAEECCPYGTDCGKQRLAEEAWAGYRDPGVVFLCQPPVPDYWTIDFRVRTLCSSITSYEFGTPPDMPPPPPPAPAQWAPLSRLIFSLDSTWFGLQLAHETPEWGFRFEWMMAGQYINNDVADFDWASPNPDGSFTDFGLARERFTEGQMIDIEYKRRLLVAPLGLPFDVWPLIGFRWQRFDITAFDLRQVKSDNVWLDPPFTFEDDVGTLNQEYYIGYAGLQLRGRWDIPKLCPILWTLQGDWGHTEANDVDHHILREGDMFIMNRTSGDCWHAGLTVEAVVTEHIGVGVQADQLYINTRGTHRWLNEPLGIDESWDNGVAVTSRQTWITAFLRIRM